MATWVPPALSTEHDGCFCRYLIMLVGGALLYAAERDTEHATACMERATENPLRERMRLPPLSNSLCV